MPDNVPSDVHLPRVDDVPRDVATLMIACAFAEVYCDVLKEPVPERLMAIVRRMQTQGG
jgi:hypothetical protein